MSARSLIVNDPYANDPVLDLAYNYFIALLSMAMKLAVNYFADFQVAMGCVFFLHE